MSNFNVTRHILEYFLFSIIPFDLYSSNNKKNILISMYYCINLKKLVMRGVFFFAAILPSGKTSVKLRAHAMHGGSVCFPVPTHMCKP